MHKKRGSNGYCTAVDKDQLLLQTNCETLIFICSELDINKMRSWFSLERTVIVPGDGGVSGIAAKTCRDRKITGGTRRDEENDNPQEQHKTWLRQFLQSQRQLRHVLICAHYGCRLLETATTELVTEQKSHHPEPETIEKLIASEKTWLQDFVADALPDNPPTVNGCLYDAEFDWLTFYDQETGLFLPANAVVSAPSGK